VSDHGGVEQVATVDIAAPPELVWEVVSNVEHWPDWTRSVRWVRRLEDGPLMTGSKAKISQPKVPTVDWVVTELEPGRSFTWVSGGRGVLTTARHVVEPLPGGDSHVRLSVEQGGLLGPLVSRLYRGLTERYLELESEGLKTHCETLAD
jgi:uncharacterized membrane protein